MDDLVAPFLGDEIDLVGGIDATGFILGRTCLVTFKYFYQCR